MPIVKHPYLQSQTDRPYRQGGFTAITQTLTNRNSALLFSGGDMAIGGALDSNHQATVAAGEPQTVVLNNISASIEALGNLNLNVATLNNQRTDFKITRQLSTTLPDDLALLQYNPALQFFWPYDEVSPLFWRNSVRDRYLNIKSRGCPEFCVNVG